MNLSLEGRNAIICGSSQGIGFAIAEELALMGANCILIARNEEKLKLAVQTLDIAIRQSHSYHVADLNKPEQTRELVMRIVSDRPVHILINNSGGPAAGPITEATEEQFINTFNQHLISSHILVKGVVEGMKKEGYGRIINIISTSVKIPLKNLGVSNTIRGAMASWAKTLSNELGQYNITVNNVLPGFTTTERLSSLVENIAKRSAESVEAVEKRMQEEVPMKRFGEPGEVAAVAAFLATPAAAYVNGVSIPVDGGRTGSI
jgi:3-oxoacyl-[acyl-carrier protein] reductase